MLAIYDNNCPRSVDLGRWHKVCIALNHGIQFAYAAGAVPIAYGVGHAKV